MLELADKNVKAALIMMFDYLSENMNKVGHLGGSVG